MGLWSCPRLKFSLSVTAAKLSVGRVGIGLVFQFFLGMGDVRWNVILTAVYVCV